MGYAERRLPRLGSGPPDIWQKTFKRTGLLQELLRETRWTFRRGEEQGRMMALNPSDLIRRTDSPVARATARLRSDCFMGCSLDERVAFAGGRSSAAKLETTTEVVGDRNGGECESRIR